MVAIRDGRTSTETVRRVGAGDDEHSHEEFVIVDPAGRLQIPSEYLRQLGIEGRAVVDVEDGKVTVKSVEDSCSARLRFLGASQSVRTKIELMATITEQPTQSYGKVGDELIRIENASRYYYIGQPNEVHAVDRVTWTIPRGRFIALRGRSGSGKTTLLNLIGGLDQPTEGRLYFEGRDMTAMGDRAAYGATPSRDGFHLPDLLPPAGALGF